MSQRRSRSQSAGPPRELISEIHQLTARLGITTWDVLLVGDGSGSGWDIGAGWASLLIDQQTWASRMFHGAVNIGTVTIGEIMPYVHGLMWYFSDDGPGRQRVSELVIAGRLLQVHIVSDNSSVVLNGNDHQTRRKNLPLWAALDCIQGFGAQLHFHHQARLENTLNLLCDEVSRQSRIGVTEAYGKTLQVLSNKFPGLPQDAHPQDFFRP